MAKIKKGKYFVIIILLVLCRTLIAQDDTSNNETSIPDQVTEQSADEIKNDNPDNSNIGLDNQVFIPSEEISEDAPVAFPVDI